MATKRTKYLKKLTKSGLDKIKRDYPDAKITLGKKKEIAAKAARHTVRHAMPRVGKQKHFQ